MAASLDRHELARFEGLMPRSVTIAFNQFRQQLPQNNYKFAGFGHLYGLCIRRERVRVLSCSMVIIEIIINIAAQHDRYFG